MGILPKKKVHGSSLLQITDIHIRVIVVQRLLLLLKFSQLFLHLLLGLGTLRLGNLVCRLLLVGLLLDLVLLLESELVEEIDALELS